MTYSVNITASATADMDEMLGAASGMREKYVFLSNISRKLGDLEQFYDLYQKPQNAALAARGYRFFALSDGLLVFYLVDEAAGTVTIVRLLSLGAAREKYEVML